MAKNYEKNAALKNLVDVIRCDDGSDTLRRLVPFVQFRKREKHPWRSVAFSKVAGFYPLLCTIARLGCNNKNS